MDISFKDHLVSILANINDVVWCIDANTYELLYVNRACYNIWGYTPEEMMSNEAYFLNSIYPEDIERYRNGILNAIIEGTSYNEFRVVNSSGTIKYIRGEAIFKKGTNGFPDTITGIAADVTDLHEINSLMSKKAIEQNFLLNETNRLTGIINKSNNIVIISDKFGCITWVNEAYTRITGYTCKECIGKKPGSLVQGKRQTRKR